MRRRRHRRFNWASLGLLFLALGAAVSSAFCARTAYRLSELRRHGVAVVAQLEGKETVGGKTISYRVHYRFQTPDGRTWQGTGSVGGIGKADWEAAGPTVTVRYLAEDPAVNCWAAELPDAGGARAAALALGLVGGLLFVCGVVATRLTPEQFQRWWIEGRPE